jgi:hypothetical protein
MTISLADSLVALMAQAAQHALARQAPIGVEDLLWALITSEPLGVHLAQHVSAPEHWKPEQTQKERANLSIWASDQEVFLDKDAEHLFIDGSRVVLLGSYEPRHLGEVICAAAEVHPERFSRFGFEARGWRRALQAKSVGH